jgi:predicted RNase H-like HicB family nuclease
MAQQATIIDQWARAAIEHAFYESLGDGRVFARVPSCPGAVATGADRREAEHELFSVLEEWAVLGMQTGDEIPIFGDENLNTSEARRYLAFHD